MRILTRYLIRSHVGPFLFALSTLTGLLIVNNIARRLQDLAGKGLPADVILEVFLLTVPHTLALTVPMSVLVAVLYTWGQLAGENEITALKASGVNIARQLVPLLVAAAVVAGAMIVFMDRILPETNHRLANLLVDIGRKSPTLQFKEQIVNEIRTGDLRTRYYLQAANIDPVTNELRDVVIYDLSQSDRYRTIYADSGRMAFNEARTDLYLTLYDGVIQETTAREPESFQRLFYDVQRIRVEGVGNQLERGEDDGYRSDRELSLAMLTAQIDSGRAELAGIRRSAVEDAVAVVDAALAGPGAELAALPAPSSGAYLLDDEFVSGEAPMPRERADVVEPDVLMRTSRALLRSAAQEADAVRERIAERQVEWHKKIAIPIACIVFVLIGAPLAIRFPRGGVGMVIAVSLGIFGVYYVGIIGGEELGDGGVISPFWAMWAPNVLFFAVGVLSVSRIARTMATSRGGGWDDLLYEARKVLRHPRAFFGR
ncbi:MAG: LptF/LptG family permease [Longimicrobiales bacterium]